MTEAKGSALQWLASIEQTGVNLTAWEQDFIAKVGPLLRRGFTLSEAQRDALEKIYAERTP